MKKDFSIRLLDVEGKPLKEGEKELLAKTIAINSLMAADPQNEKTTGEEKARRYKLGMDIQKDGEVDLKPEDISMLKKLIGMFYTPLVVGQMYEFLDA